jgi:uncharacterized protein (DUF1778 family)
MPRSKGPRKPRTNMETFRSNDDERQRLNRAAKKVKTPRTVFVREAVMAKVAAVLDAA